MRNSSSHTHCFTSSPTSNIDPCVYLEDRHSDAQKTASPDGSRFNAPNIQSIPEVRIKGQITSVWFSDNSCALINQG